MRQWELESLKAAIASHGLVIAGIKDIQHGKQITLTEGVKANWYTSGKVVIQGKILKKRNFLLSN